MTSPPTSTPASTPTSTPTSTRAHTAISPDTSPPAPLLSAAGINFAYARAHPVLRDVAVEFPAGALVAIVGPNGAGKSTLLRVLAGVAEPQTGTVALAVAPSLHALPPRQRAARVAFVAQRPEVAFAFSVREVVALGLYATSPQTANATTAALAALDLTAFADAPFATLSAGQQQRVSLARAMAQLGLPSSSHTTLPKVLLADEPVASMDPRNALASMRLLRDAADRGNLVVCVLHDVSLVARWATHALLLTCDGRVAAFGPLHLVLTPANLQHLFGVRFTPLWPSPSSATDPTPCGHAPVPPAMIPEPDQP